MINMTQHLLQTLKKKKYILSVGLVVAFLTCPFIIIIKFMKLVHQQC